MADPTTTAARLSLDQHTVLQSGTSGSLDAERYAAEDSSRHAGTLSAQADTPVNGSLQRHTGLQGAMALVHGAEANSALTSTWPGFTATPTAAEAPAVSAGTPVASAHAATAPAAPRAGALSLLTQAFRSAFGFGDTAHHAHAPATAGSPLPDSPTPSDPTPVIPGHDPLPPVGGPGFTPVDPINPGLPGTPGLPGHPDTPGAPTVPVPPSLPRQRPISPRFRLPPEILIN